MAAAPPLGDQPFASDDPWRQRIRGEYLADDDLQLAALAPLAHLGDDSRGVETMARRWVETLRQASRPGSAVNTLLTEFSLSSEEGVVLMCLAEALLRVPDDATVDRLIADRIAAGDWAAHTGGDRPLLVSAAAWGLLLSGRFMGRDQQPQLDFGDRLHQLTTRLGQRAVRAAIRRAMALMGEQFVFAETIDQALTRARREETDGLAFSYDMLGEGARTGADAERYFKRYLQAISAIGMQPAGPEAGAGISVKLSALHPRFEYGQRQQVLAELVPRLCQLVEVARQADMGLTIDAEEAHRLELTLDVMETVLRTIDLKNWRGFGLAVQAYQKRAMAVIDWCYAIAGHHHCRLAVRLVKGAYWDTEIKLAQVRGLADYPVFSRKPATDVSYLACARRLLAFRDRLYPQFATHNAHTLAAVVTMAGQAGGFELQRLHGMGEALHELVRNDCGHPCRIYAPVGEKADLLAYLVRRLLENGANSSFVNHWLDPAISVDELVTDPLARLQSLSPWRHPDIPLPGDLYGSVRANSRGFEVADPDALEQCRRGMARSWRKQGQTDVCPAGGNARYNPADTREIIGVCPPSDSPQDFADKLEQAEQALPRWRELPVQARAQRLLCFADKLEHHRDELMMLCIKEAGKTVADSLAEVREAIDFCRYYAQLAVRSTATGSSQGRGVVLCISPWNFPLAIFTGQVVAALVSGNTVLAKPSNNTPLIALRVLELFEQCDLPAGVATPVIAGGAEIESHLIGDPRIQAVLFTGSTATARRINQRLAERPDGPITIVAETGGLNAMIVDSTALPEQVVDDVIRSAFTSAGQRCSALRLLCVQHELAPRLIDMLGGALAEWTTGDPALLATDMGPLIDAGAVAAMKDHVATLELTATAIHRGLLPESCNHGHFFAPHLYEMPELSTLREEVFGPVLHLVRYSADNLDGVIDAINASGYGLTCGVHSRIHTVTDRVAGRVQAGNLYINRDMIGAVVGVQPFGGRGLSGTGPKAGGPHYLYPLVGEAREAQIDLSPPARATTESRQLPPLALLADGFEHWRQVPVQKRRTRLERGLMLLRSSRLAPFAAFDAAGRAGRQLTDQLQQSPWLPGPTGEANKLVLEPRGLFLFVLDPDFAPASWLPMATAALMAGNVALFAVVPGQAALAQAVVESWRRARVPDQVTAVVEMALWEEQGALASTITHPAFAGVCVAPMSPLRCVITRLMAARQGALIPVIADDWSPASIYQLVHEKTVTENTVASGGNVTLLRLE